MSWWSHLWRRRNAEQQLDKELRFHLDQHTADLIASGHSPADARREARIALGGPEQVKEECRDVRSTQWLEDLVRDLRYALRSLGQRPGFAAVALSTLALGTAATTVIFTVAYGVLLKPLVYPQPDRLVLVQEQTDWATQWGSLWAFAYPNFLDCRRASRSADLAAWRYASGTISYPGEAEAVEGREISSNLFPVLGLTLPLGRAFLSDEDRPGAQPVAIIGDGLWKRRFASDPSAIGRRLVLDGKSYTVVGVTPPAFRLAGEDVDVFIPIGQNPEPVMANRDVHPGVRVWGRLRPGATLASAQAELAVTAHQLQQQYPKSNKGRSFPVERLRPAVGDVRSTLWLLLGAVTLVLLIACANIASLLLARTISREREFAMRLALGASRGRVVRQCLAESAALALAGGMLGVLLATEGIRPFVALWPGNLPRAEEIALDWHVLAFALAISLLSAFLFGVAPALRAPVRDLDRTLRAGGRTIATGASRLHGIFVAGEIAMAAVLLVCAGMLGRTMLKLASLDPGVDIHNVLAARASLSPGTLADTGRTRAAWQEILDRALQVPGVQAVAMVDTVPMREGNNPIGYWTTPALPPEDRQPIVMATCVSPEYFKVMAIPLRRGRLLDERDRAGGEPAVVIDEVMADQAFHGQDPVGKHLWIGFPNDPVTVVGVVGHVRYWGLAGDDSARVRAQLYNPFAQLPDQYVRRWSELMSLAVRTSADPLSVVEPLRHEIRGTSNDQVLYEVRTLEQLASASIARQRFLTMLFGVFASLALLLACIGIYGVLAYLMNRRVPEFGVRLALGARPGDIGRLVLRQSLGMIVSGAAIGILGSLAAARLLKSGVTGVQPPEPLTFAVTIATLVTAALFASLVPARRASRIDPVAALREE
jgi:predicted permease